MVVYHIPGSQWRFWLWHYSWDASKLHSLPQSPIFSQDGIHLDSLWIFMTEISSSGVGNTTTQEWDMGLFLKAQQAAAIRYLHANKTHSLDIMTAHSEMLI